MGIPHDQLPLLYAPLFSGLFFYCGIAALGYLAGPGAISGRLKRWIGWSEADDRSARGSWLGRGLAMAFFVGFPTAGELVVVDEFREQVRIGNIAGVVLLVLHWLFIAAWTIYLVRVAATRTERARSL